MSSEPLVIVVVVVVVTVVVFMRVYMALSLLAEARHQRGHKNIHLPARRPTSWPAGWPGSLLARWPAGQLPGRASWPGPLAGPPRTGEEDLPKKHIFGVKNENPRFGAIFG